MFNFLDREQVFVVVKAKQQEKFKLQNTSGDSPIYHIFVLLVQIFSLLFPKLPKRLIYCFGEQANRLTFFAFLLRFLFTLIKNNTGGERVLSRLLSILRLSKTEEQQIRERKK